MQNPSGLDDGVYNVTISDGNCEVFASTTINPGIILVADLIPEADQCFEGNSFSFDATGSTDPQVSAPVQTCLSIFGIMVMEIRHQAMVLMPILEPIPMGLREIMWSL